MVHALFGVMWFGIHVLVEMIFVPVLTKSTKLVELAPVARFAPSVSSAGNALGILTTVTGVVFLYIKFPPDQVDWLGFGETQAIIAALVTAFVSLVFANAVLRPAALALTKDAPATPPPPDAEIPPPLLPRLKRVAMYMRIQTSFVVLMLVFMVIAIEGGF
jgi:hypothetical protein